MSSEMQNILVYLTAFFMVFLSFVIFSLCLRVLLWIYMQYYNRQQRRSEPSDIERHLRGDRCAMRIGSDRQGNIFTIADETTNNSIQHRCPDFFYVEPSAEDAARMRAQLEKDQKDLPTYEEVMAMSVAQAHAGSLGVPPPHCVSNTSITATTPHTTVVPPYIEVNTTNVSHQAPPPTPVSGTNGAAPVWPLAIPTTTGIGTSTVATGSVTASTSRAAAAATTNTLTAVTIANSVSNTSV